MIQAAHGRTSLGISGRNLTKNRDGSRTTHHINRRVTQSIFRAFDFATAIGSPLNLYVVLNLLERDEATAAELFARVRHKYRDWLNYKGKIAPEAATPPAYVYTLENPSGAHPHVNWALYIPPQLQAEFERKLPRWLEKVQGECRPHDCHVQSINQRFSKRLAKYVVKATEAGYVKHFFLEEVASDQGKILGKRAGVSPSLGHVARREVGFKPARNRWRKAA